MTDSQDADGRQSIQCRRVAVGTLKKQSHKAWVLNERLKFSHHKRMLWQVKEHRGLGRIIWKDVTNGKWTWHLKLWDIRSFCRTEILKTLVGIQFLRWLKWFIYPAEDSVGFGILIIGSIYSWWGKKGKTHCDQVFKGGILEELVLLLILSGGCRTSNRRRTYCFRR